jgi:hypothetical protein
MGPHVKVWRRGGIDLNDGVKKVIVESVDTALGSFDNMDKAKLYRTLETKYGLKLEDIPVKYEVFHKALSEMLGVDHFTVERKIVEVLHWRSKTGVYDEAHEIPAFAILVESYMSELSQTVFKNKVQIEKNLQALDKLKKASV